MSVFVEETGVPNLDDLMGGLPHHGVMMLIGAPGTGKTVLALQIGMHRARLGSDVIFLTAYSEPHDKLFAHMVTFSFFEEEFIGEKIYLLSLKPALSEGAEQTIETVLRSARGKERPLIILDGYRGMREALGADAARNLIASLSSQLPYLDGSAIITAEGRPNDPDQYAELTSADALIALHYPLQEARTFRTLQVIKVRGRSHREGMHGFTITDQGIKVYPRLASFLPPDVPVPSDRRYAFDLAEFDAMLNGGLPEFTTTIIFGDPGSGRTTFALHYLLAGASHGERGLLVTFRNSLSDLLAKADQLGLDLRSPLDRDHIDVLEVPPVEINPYILAWNIRELVERRRPVRLVIDSISDLEQSPAIQQSQRDFLAALNLYLRRAGTTCVMIRDSDGLQDYGIGGVNDVRIPAANNRVLLRRVAFRGRFYRICSVINMERSDHDTSIREFRISHGGIRVLPQDESETGVLTGIARESPAVVN